MTKQLLSLVVFFLMVGIGCNAHASITYIADNRYIDHTLNPGGPITPSPAFADFNVGGEISEAGAFQNTVLTDSTMSGSGKTYARDAAKDYGAEAYSDFSITFSVDELTDFSLTGGIGTSYYLPTSVGVSLQIDGIPTNFFSFIDSDVPNEGFYSFSFDGQFSPDNTYTLDLWSYAADSGDYDQDWTFDLTTSSAVPIPASAWLLGSSLVGLIGAAKQRLV